MHVKLDDGEAPLVLQVDVYDRHKTMRDRQMSAVLSIDDVELEFPNNMPVEGDNLIEQDGFKNPYFRKRANSLILKQKSKFLFVS